MTAGRLLILDDDPHVGKMVSAIAATAGLGARFSANTADFFLALDEWRPTHLAIDMIMPEMDGVAVLFELAERGCRADIILISGVGAKVLDAAAEFAVGRGLRIAGVLSKPFTPHDLRTLLAAEPPAPC